MKLLMKFITLTFLVFLVIVGCSDVINGTQRKTDDIPQDFLAESGYDSGEIYLEWTEVPDVEGYMILRSTTPTGDFDTIATLVPDILYADLVPADGSKYYYKVLAVYLDGSTSFPSDVKSAIGYIVPVSDTTVTVDTTNLVGLDTLVTIDTIVATDTIVTTKKYEITTDTTVISIDSLDKGVSFYELLDTTGVAIDTALFFTYVDTLGVTTDTISINKTKHLLGLDTLETIDSAVGESSDTVVTTKRYEISSDTTILTTTWLAQGVAYDTIVDTTSVVADTTLFYSFVDTLGKTQDTTSVVSTINLIGYDTIQSVDSTVLGNLDTVVTTIKSEISSDTTVARTTWLNIGVPYDTTFDTGSVTVDTVVILTFADTLGQTMDTTVTVDTTTKIFYDTLIVKDSVVQGNLDTVVTTVTTQEKTDSVFIITDSLLNLVSFNTVIDTTESQSALTLSTVKDTLTYSSGVAFPSVVLFEATDGDATAGTASIDLSWTDCGVGFTYDLYVIRPNITYDNTTYEVLVSGLTSPSYSDIAALPSYQTYKLVVKHSQMTDSLQRTDIGFRLISNLEFFHEYNNTVLMSQSKLTLMHKNGLDAVGTEDAGGDSSGIIDFEASGGLFGAEAINDYTNYRDFHITLDGRQYTDISNVFSQTGTTTDSVFVTGLYGGKINLHITVSGGDPAGGYYTITQTGLSAEDVQFSTVSDRVLNNPYMP